MRLVLIIFHHVTYRKPYHFGIYNIKNQFWKGIVFFHLKSRKPLLQQYIGIYSVRIYHHPYTLQKEEEIAREEECDEALSYNNEILEETDELITRLENNNLSRFNKLLDFYNQPGITDKIILILFNWIALDDNTSNNFISIFKNKLNYTIINFPHDNSAETDKSLLMNFLEKRCLSYHYTEMLTLIDYNTLTLEEWNFL